MLQIPADIEKVLKDQEKRRRDFVQSFYAKYETNEDDSEDEEIDMQTLTVFRPKRKFKKKLNNSFKNQKRSPPKVIRFGEMNSYCISIESYMYIRKIEKVIDNKRKKKRKKNSNRDSDSDCEIKELKVTGTTKIMVTKNKIDKTFDHEKSDLPEDDDKSICNESQNETLPLNCKFNMYCPLACLYNPDSTMLNFLAGDQSKISRKVKNSVSEIRLTSAYSQNFTNRPTFNALRNGLSVCSLTDDRVATQNEYLEFSSPKYVNSSCQSVNNFSTPKLVDKNSSGTLKVKKCYVELQRIATSQNESPKSSQNVSSSSQLKFIKDRMSANSNDKGVQRHSQKIPNYKRKLRKFKYDTPVAMQKRLRPRCPNSGLKTLKYCSCKNCVEQKIPQVEYNKENKSENTSSTIVLKKQLKTRNSNKQLKPRKIISSDKKTAKKLNNQKKISVTHFTEKSSSDDADTNNVASSVVKHFSNPIKDISQYSSVESPKGKDRNTPSTLCDRRNTSQEASNPIELKESNILPKENFSLLKKSDAINFNHGCINSPPKTSKNLSTEKRSCKNLPTYYSHITTLNSRKSFDQFSSSSSVVEKSSSGYETPTRISKDESSYCKNKLQNISHSSPTQVSNTVPNNLCYQPRKTFLSKLDKKFDYYRKTSDAEFSDGISTEKCPDKDVGSISDGISTEKSSDEDDGSISDGISTEKSPDENDGSISDEVSSVFHNLSISSCGNTKYSSERQHLPNNGSASSQEFKSKNQSRETYNTAVRGKSETLKNNNLCPQPRKAFLSSLEKTFDNYRKTSEGISTEKSSDEDDGNISDGSSSVLRNLSISSCGNTKYSSKRQHLPNNGSASSQEFKSKNQSRETYNTAVRGKSETLQNNNLCPQPRKAFLSSLEKTSDYFKKTSDSEFSDGISTKKSSDEDDGNISDGCSSVLSIFSVSSCGNTQCSGDGQLLSNNGIASSSQVLKSKNKSRQTSDTAVWGKRNSLPEKSISLLEKPVENLNHDYIKSCNEMLSKLLTVESSGKNYCPQISSPVAASYSLSAEKNNSSSSCITVKDCSSGEHSLLESKGRIHICKDKFKISSNKGLIINENSLNKDTSLPQIGNLLPRHKKMSEHGTSLASGICEDFPNKDISTPRSVRLDQDSRPRKICTPNAYPSKNADSLLSCSVQKPNRKNVQHADKFANSPNKDISTTLSLKEHSRPRKILTPNICPAKNIDGLLSSSVQKPNRKNVQHADKFANSPNKDISTTLSVKEHSRPRKIFIPNICPAKNIDVLLSSSVQKPNRKNVQHADKFANSPNKDISTTLSVKEHLRPRKILIPNTCPAKNADSLLSCSVQNSNRKNVPHADKFDNSPNKDISTPRSVKEHSRPRKIFTPNICPAKNVDSLLSCSVQKPNRKNVPHADKFDNSPNKDIYTTLSVKEHSRPRKIFTPNTCPAKNADREYVPKTDKFKALRKFNKSRDHYNTGSHQNRTFDDHHYLRNKPPYSICCLGDNLQETFSIPTNCIFTPQFPKKMASLKPFSKKLKFTPNLPIDSLSMC